jgi:hypothetical protein
MKKMVNGVIVDMTPEEIAEKEQQEREWAIYKAEYDAKAYQRSRAAEYPSLADFADAYYWAQNGDDTKMTAYIEKCAEVKTKYPKV